MSDFIERLFNITWQDVANNGRVIPTALLILVVCLLYRSGCLDWIRFVKRSRRIHILTKQFRSVFIDSDTGVEYLVGDNGHFCPRLNSKGEVIINKMEDDD